MAFKHIDPEVAYTRIKNSKVNYVEEVHCPMIIKVLADPSMGTLSAFCTHVGISDRTFYKWKNSYPLFNECFRYGMMVSQENWEEEGRQGKGNPEFNLDQWKVVGQSRYGIGKSCRIRVEVESDKNPYIQYQQLMDQASHGDFSAAELKQLMESINVGTRTYETFELQKEINKLRADLLKVEEINANNRITDQEAEKRDPITISHANGESED